MGPSHVRHDGQLNPSGTNGISPVRVTPASSATAPACTISVVMAGQFRLIGDEAFLIGSFQSDCSRCLRSV